MRYLSIPAMLIVTLPALGNAPDRELRCEEIKQEIRIVQSKMRAGYTRAEGEKLRARLRKLRALRAKACR